MRIHLDFEISRRAKVAIGWLTLAVASGVAATAIAWNSPDATTAGMASGQPLSAKPLKAMLDEASQRLDAAEKFVGFSVLTTNFTEPPGSFEPVLFPLAPGPGVVEFGGADFNAGTGIYTAPQTGYYRLSTFGFAQTTTPSADTRVAYVFRKNGADLGIGGAQLSAGDSPQPSVTLIAQLQIGDQVQLVVYCPTGVQLGNPAYPFRFQGEFLGQ